MVTRLTATDSHRLCTCFPEHISIIAQPREKNNPAQNENTCADKCTGVFRKEKESVCVRKQKAIVFMWDRPGAAPQSPVENTPKNRRMLSRTDDHSLILPFSGNNYNGRNLRITGQSCAFLCFLRFLKEAFDVFKSVWYRKVNKR